MTDLYVRGRGPREADPNKLKTTKWNRTLGAPELPEPDADSEVRCATDVRRRKSVGCRGKDIPPVGPLTSQVRLPEDGTLIAGGGYGVTQDGGKHSGALDCPNTKTSQRFLFFRRTRPVQS